MLIMERSGNQSISLSSSRMEESEKVYVITDVEPGNTPVDDLPEGWSNVHVGLKEIYTKWGGSYELQNDSTKRTSLYL